MNAAVRKCLKFAAPAGLVAAYQRRRTKNVPPPKAFYLPSQTLGELFPEIQRVQVILQASEINRGHHCLLPLAEMLTLAAICRYLEPKRIFEIGTYTGSTTLAMALNTPDDTEIFTLDLEPGFEEGGGGGSRADVGRAFKGSPVVSKIRQVFGDSTQFDFRPFYQSIDLVLIDANHTYEFVKQDTTNALAMLRPGGVVVWDDYIWSEEFPECVGVSRCLHELAGSEPCVRIAGTRLAVHMRAAGELADRAA